MANEPRQAGAAAQTAPADWRRYPHLDQALLTEEPAVLAQIEKTCRALDGLQQTGSTAEKHRAATALAAYGRALELYHDLVERRDRALAEPQQGRPRSR
jgi:hypothetical protein